MSVQPSYNNTLLYLNNLEKYGIKLGLKRIKVLLKSIGNPQNKLQIIHVGGTNGKGSTSAIIASILHHAGYRVGLYTSPHLVRFNERIKINGRDISDKKVVELVERIKGRGKGQGARGKDKEKITLTFFEFTTAMAFLYFMEEKVDIVIMEVGLGGRLDATNVGNPLISIITNIAKDHEAILGNSIEDIAFEKAGIIKKGSILISGETKPAALKVLTDECRKKRAIFYRIGKEFLVRDIKSRSNGSNSLNSLNRFCFRGRRWILKGLEINLHGAHQYFNAACAIAALEILEEKRFFIPASAIRMGLKKVSWPGRLEILSNLSPNVSIGGNPLIVLDCAHNPSGASVLKDALLKEFIYKRLFLVIGIMADKDIKGILSKLVPLSDIVILTRPKIMRATTLDMLYKLTAKKIEVEKILLIEEVRDACKKALSMANGDDMVCITGSVFTVGEARDFLVKGKR